MVLKEILEVEPPQIGPLVTSRCKLRYKNRNYYIKFPRLNQKCLSLVSNERSNSKEEFKT